MNIDDPIITSMLDDDLYKFSMGAVVFHKFPHLEVSYGFINRGNIQFPPGFAIELKKQLKHLSNVKMTPEELRWLKDLPYIRPTYAEWLYGFQYDPEDVHIDQAGGSLIEWFAGPWYKQILWEVKLMAIKSELYFRMTGHKMARDWQERIVKKANDLEDSNCQWADMGTRRRRSLDVQNEVVGVMKNFKGFVGTSNPYLAMKHGVKPMGTSAHEATMVMECLYGAYKANTKWLDNWYDYYEGKLGIALTDTYTTPVFLNGMGWKELNAWDGMRQDSGDPYKCGKLIMDHYKSYYVSTDKKTIVFSDNLNVPKGIHLTNTFRPHFGKVILGIGTNFSNDTFTKEQKAEGQKPLNMVIKLSGVNVDGKWIGAVKLSDDIGKNTGKPEDIYRVRQALNLV